MYPLYDKYALYNMLWHIKQNNDHISAGHGVMIRGNYNWVCHNWESPAKHKFSLKVFTLLKRWAIYISAMHKIYIWADTKLQFQMSITKDVLLN